MANDESPIDAFDSDVPSWYQLSDPIPVPPYPLPVTFPKLATDSVPDAEPSPSTSRINKSLSTAVPPTNKPATHVN